MSPRASDLIWVVWWKCLGGSTVMPHPLAGVGTLPFSHLAFPQEHWSHWQQRLDLKFCGWVGESMLLTTCPVWSSGGVAPMVCISIAASFWSCPCFFSQINFWLWSCTALFYRSWPHTCQCQQSSAFCIAHAQCMLLPDDVTTHAAHAHSWASEVNLV